MFSNAYNKKIADDVFKLNKKFIEHSKRVGRTMSGGADYMMEGGNWIDDMTSGISQGMNAVLGPISAVAQNVAPLLPLLAAGKPRKAGRPRKVAKGMTGGAVVGSGSTGGKRKAGRPRKVAKGIVEEPVLNEKEGGKKKKAGRPRKVAKGMEGEGIFSSLLSKIGLGEGEEMVNEVEGGKKRKGLKKAGRPRKGKGITGGAETGGAKKKPVSKWIEHVKAFAKKHKMKYNEALKDPRCKSSYKK